MRWSWVGCAAVLALLGGCSGGQQDQASTFSPPAPVASPPAVTSGATAAPSSATAAPSSATAAPSSATAAPSSAAAAPSSGTAGPAGVATAPTGKPQNCKTLSSSHGYHWQTRAFAPATCDQANAVIQGVFTKLGIDPDATTFAVIGWQCSENMVQAGGLASAQFRCNKGPLVVDATALHTGE